MRVSRNMLAIMLVGLLAGCSSAPKTADEGDSVATKQEVEEKAEKAPLPICPQVAIVRGLDMFLRTKNGNAYDERDVKPEDMLSGAKMTRVRGECVYRKMEVVATFKLGMTAIRGPLLEGLRSDFPYFVAVVDPEGRIIDKMAFEAEVGFSSEKPQMDHEESLRVLIPLKQSDHASGASYQVLMGFQREKKE